MELRKTIKKVLKEDKIKFLFRIITKLIEDFLSKDYVEKYVCDYKLEPGIMDKRYQTIKVTIYFDSGPGSKNWPMTQAVRYKEEDIMGELQDLILNLVGVYVAMYSSSTPNCKKIEESLIKEEESSALSFIKRRTIFKEEEIKKYLKKFAIRVFEPNKKMDYIISKACHDTAYEILDSITSSVDDNTYREYEYKLTNFLKEKYGDFIKEFLTEFYDAEGDELGGKYVFAKHSERNGGTGFMSSYNTWNELLKEYSWWFTDLDWKEIKRKIDDKMGFPLIIKKPGDVYNTMNYYFSVKRLK
jgi:hypothetical protein